MSSIEKYELLKKEGSWVDRLKYILSLSDKIEIELYLKKSYRTSYDDLQMLVFLSKSTKNQANLMEIFKIDTLPVRQRGEAAKAWLQFQHDPKQIRQFVIEAVTDSNLPRFLKHQILKHLHHLACLKRSPSFFHDLACCLTESLHHEQFNLDAHLLPFCSFDQIHDLLSRWSLTRSSQISCSSPLHSKLARYQPLISIHLIKGDLREKCMNYDELWTYAREHKQLLKFLARKEPKAMCDFAREYVNRSKNPKKILPHFVQSEQKRLFDKAPDQMIELISSVASLQLGIIKYDSPWDYSGFELSTFDFPRSFSIDHYTRLFMVLYETCQWSVNNISSIINYMLKGNPETQSRSSLRRQRKWFFDRVIEERIGKEEFLDKLLKNSSEDQLHSLRDFHELSIPFARHLLAQLNQTEVISAYRRASFLRYEYLTSDIFDQFLSLFQQCGSDVNERKWTYNHLLQCAVSTDQQSVKRVLQWIDKRFVNEQLVVIESFLRNISSCDTRFHLDYLPNNFESLESIMNIAFNHIQRTSTTIEIILSYGLLLLNRAENASEKIQEFACRIIKRYYSTTVTFPCDCVVLPKARRLFADILIEDIFPKLISKSMVTEIQNLLTNCFHNAWRLPQIDAFLHSFFFEHLRASKKLQSEFNIDEHSSLISLLLKPRSTRLERAYRLFSEIDQAFILHADVQRALLRTDQYRQEINKLLQSEKYLNLDRLSGEETNFHCQKIIPGFDLTVLNTCYYQLTGQQQEHVTNVILNDFLLDSEIANFDKLKALRVLRRLIYTHQKTLQWLEQKPDSFLAASTDDSLNSKPTRGANIQTINHYIPSLPATFDLISQDLFKQFDQLLARLNASNATYLGNSLLCISQKVADRDFLQHYIEFIRSERFTKIGITAAKALLRLLVQYRFDSTLITSVFKSLWDSKPHPDIRACLITILINFIHDSTFTGEESVIWSILEEAANDDYDPVVLALCGADAKAIRRPSRRLEASPNNLRIFVQRIQMKMLDHPTSLTMRIWAWSLLDTEYCNIDLVTDKARQLCIEFDKNANVLWKEAFQRMLLFYKQKKISANDVVDFIQSIMNHRNETDVSLDTLDYQNDLPIYHRINNLLELFITSMNEIDLQARLCFRSFAVSLLQFEITMASLSGKLLMKLAQTRQDLEDILTVFQQHLPAVYFEHVTIELASVLAANDGSCCFVQQLTVDEKFQLALWFVNEKDRPLFVFDLLKNEIFNKASVDKQQCQLLLRQMRQSENLLLRQRALQYKVPWRKDGTINDENN